VEVKADERVKEVEVKADERVKEVEVKADERVKEVEVKADEKVKEVEVKAEERVKEVEVKAERHRTSLWRKMALLLLRDVLLQKRKAKSIFMLREWQRMQLQESVNRRVQDQDQDRDAESLYKNLMATENKNQVKKSKEAGLRLLQAIYSRINSAATGKTLRKWQLSQFKDKFIVVQKRIGMNLISACCARKMERELIFKVKDWFLQSHEALSAGEEENIKIATSLGMMSKTIKQMKAVRLRGFLQTWNLQQKEIKHMEAIQEAVTGHFSAQMRMIKLTMSHASVRGCLRTWLIATLRSCVPPPNKKETRCIPAKLLLEQGGNALGDYLEEHPNSSRRIQSEMSEVSLLRPAQQPNAVEETGSGVPAKLLLEQGGSTTAKNALALSNYTPKQLKSYFKHLFKIGDRDGSGTLDRKEIDQLLNHSGFQFDLGSVDDVLRAGDQNGDGLLDLAEFVALMTQATQATQAQTATVSIGEATTLIETEEEVEAIRAARAEARKAERAARRGKRDESPEKQKKPAAIKLKGKARE